MHVTFVQFEHDTTTVKVDDRSVAEVGSGGAEFTFGDDQSSVSPAVVVPVGVAVLVAPVGVAVSAPSATDAPSLFSAPPAPKKAKVSTKDA